MTINLPASFRLNSATATGRNNVGIPVSAPKIPASPAVKDSFVRFSGKDSPSIFDEAKRGHVHQVKKLMRTGNPNRTDEEGNTALHIAAANGQVDVVNALLKNPKVDVDAQNQRGNTAFHEAAERASGEVMFADLFGAPFRKQEEIARARQIIGALAAKHANPNIRNKWESTPLLAMTDMLGEPNKEVVEALLEAGANPNVSGRSESTPLRNLVYQRTPDKIGVMKTLLRKGAEPDYGPSGNAWKALHIAASQPDVPAIKVLAKAKADVNGQVSYESAPLHFAVNDSKGHTRAVKTLLRLGADPNILDAGGRAPIHIAAEHGNRAVVKKLIRGGANPFELDGKGNSPRDLALKYQHEDTADLFRAPEAYLQHYARANHPRLADMLDQKKTVFTEEAKSDIKAYFKRNIESVLRNQDDYKKYFGEERVSEAQRTMEMMHMADIPFDPREKHLLRSFKR